MLIYHVDLNLHALGKLSMFSVVRISLLKIQQFIQIFLPFWINDKLLYKFEKYFQLNCLDDIINSTVCYC